MKRFLQLTFTIAFVLCAMLSLSGCSSLQKILPDDMGTRHYWGDDDPWGEETILSKTADSVSFWRRFGLKSGKFVFTLPAGTGSLLVGAAVIGMNARFDAVSHRAIRIFHVVESAAAAEAAGSRDGQICNGRRCALAIIILTKCDLVRIDVDPVLDRHAGSIGGHRQCCEHGQCQYKAQQHFFVFRGSSYSDIR